MGQNQYSFVAVIEPGEDVPYVVSFPDLPGCYTQGDSREEALRSAREALELHLYGMEKEGYEIPEPSPADKISIPDGGLVEVLDVWMPFIRERIGNKAIKLTVTIPRWLKEAAEDRKVNYSQVLQAALKEYLGLKVGYK